MLGELKPRGPKGVIVAVFHCTGGPDVIRNEAWSFYRTISGVRLCEELEEPKGPKGPTLPTGGLLGARFRILPDTKLDASLARMAKAPRADDQDR